MWSLYDRLIERVPRDGDAIVRACVGTSWTAVLTKAGRIGVAATPPSRSSAPFDAGRYEGMALAEAAKQVKSWDFAEAGVGLAAINAAINVDARFGVTENPDAFLRYRDRAAGRKVAVIGHFAYLERRLADLCDLYVLERKPGDNDYPDPACEYILPEMDLVFITGSALANKTMPRLLQLCSRAFTVISGPSTTMDESLFDLGADALCGFLVTDAQRCLSLVGEQTGIFSCGRMVCLEKTGETLK